MKLNLFKPIFLNKIKLFTIGLLLNSIPAWAQNNRSTNLSLKSHKDGYNTVLNGSNAIATTYTMSACGLNYVQASNLLYKRNSGCPVS